MAHCPIYTPDLLNICSSVQPLEVKLQNTPFPSQQNLSYDSSDYAEIDEICLELHSTKTQTNSNAAKKPYKNGDENEITSSNNLKAVATTSDMGQNLSLRRPRISLTWILREQHTPSNHNNNNTTLNNEHKNGGSGEEKLFSEKYVSNHNLQEFQEKREPSKELLFVCTPSQKPQHHHHKPHHANTTESLIKRRNFEKNSKLQQQHQQLHHHHIHSHHQTQNPLKSSENNVLDKLEKLDETKSLKSTYSEPSLVAASETNHTNSSHHRRHRHRRRRGDRNRMQKFGYEIRNIDEFLTKCSLSSPGNIPVVLATASTLYQTRPGGYQIEISLPLGMVVNAVFKNQNWLYVQTPHAQEGYVVYSACMPLGILPPTVKGNGSLQTTPCWENTGDVFPMPCGNMTDSEKEVQLRGGTRSEGARTPRPKKYYHQPKPATTYSQSAKLAEKAYAQLRTIQMCTEQKAQEAMKLQQQKTKEKTAVHHKRFSKGLRQTLVAITNNYTSENLTVQKGDIVTLVECRESKDHKQWFYVKTRDDREGFIPAEVAGHGFL
uniref:SH3 domain-containing protein n=1 Tax=Megaselia scalaris TaxID=36166 RepID=T1GQT5_MEGSC